MENMLSHVVEFLKSLGSRDPKDAVIAMLFGAVVFLWNDGSAKNGNCDQRVAATEKAAQERYSASIAEMANHYSRAMIRCEEEKRIVLLDCYKKVDSLQVRYKIMEIKINQYMSQHNGG